MPLSVSNKGCGVAAVRHQLRQLCVAAVNDVLATGGPKPVLEVRQWDGPRYDNAETAVYQSDWDARNIHVFPVEGKAVDNVLAYMITNMPGEPKYFKVYRVQDINTLTSIPGENTLVYGAWELYAENAGLDQQRDTPVLFDVFTATLGTTSEYGSNFKISYQRYTHPSASVGKLYVFKFHDSNGTLLVQIGLRVSDLPIEQAEQKAAEQKAAKQKAAAEQKAAAKQRSKRSKRSKRSTLDSANQDKKFVHDFSQWV
jgi:hypothetical protein